MSGSSGLKVSKFFCTLFFLLAFAFGLARDGWHCVLFITGGVMWILCIIIWGAVAEQDDETKKR